MLHSQDFPQKYSKIIVTTLSQEKWGSVVAIYTNEQSYANHFEKIVRTNLETCREDLVS